MSDETYTVLAVWGDDQRADQHLEQRAREALTSFLPAANVRRIGPETISRLPAAAALIVAEPAHARIARATGFEGGIVLAAAPANADEHAAFLAQGTHCTDPASAPDALADALRAAIPLAPDGTPERVPAATARTRRVLAAGELALTLQHAFNNPLTALMAEVQLLQMEAQHGGNEETKAAAGRMLDLVRRLTEISRSLDAVRDR